MLSRWAHTYHRGGRPGSTRPAARNSSPRRSAGCSTWCHRTTACTGCCAGTRLPWPLWPGTTRRRAWRVRGRDTARRGIHAEDEPAADGARTAERGTAKDGAGEDGSRGHGTGGGGAGTGQSEGGTEGSRAEGRQGEDGGAEGWRG